MSVDKEYYPYFSRIGGLGLRHERDLRSRRSHLQRCRNILLEIGFLVLRRIQRIEALAIPNLRVSLVDFYLQASKLPIPLLILGIIAKRVGGVFIGDSKDNSVFNL